MSGSGRQRVFSSFDRPRRRFVQDGEVPVTVIHPRPRQGLEALGPARPGVSPLERAESAEAALATERTAREQAERALREAQATILDLRTKQGHAELARAEAADAAEALRVELATQRQELAETRAALAAAETARARAPAEEVIRRRRRTLHAAPGFAAAEMPAGEMPAGEMPDRAVVDHAMLDHAMQDHDRANRDEAGVGAAETAVPVRRGRGRPRSLLPKPPATRTPKPVKWWLKPATAAAKPAAKVAAKPAKPTAKLTPKPTGKPTGKRAAKPPVRRRGPRAF